MTNLFLYLKELEFLISLLNRYVFMANLNNYNLPKYFSYIMCHMRGGSLQNLMMRQMGKGE